jgi:Zn finger protein HypA/HybF involved in hydrogenase expression
MHEHHIAVRLLNEAIQRLEGRPPRHIRLRNGVFSGVATESLRMYMEMALLEAACDGVKFEIEESAGKLQCSACGHQWETRRLADPCPSCRSEKTTLLSGKECEVLEVS